MKTVLLIILLLGISAVATAQDRFVTKSGHIWFYSKTPLETIEAHNNQVATVISTKKGTIAFDIIMKSFKFQRALMEEHFNENYIESEKFPKCTFTGKFLDFDLNNFTKPGTYKVTVEGDMTMHGVTKHVKEAGTLEIKEGSIYAKSKFHIIPQDYNINIPGIVKDKIAANMEINVDIQYQAFK